MKVKLFLCLTFLAITLNSFCQSEQVDLKTFTVPTLPAFTILNLGTQSINRPTNTKGVAASLLSSVNGNLINPNVAIEIAPFWLKKQSLTFSDYYQLKEENDWKKELGQNVWRNLAFSIATTKIGDNKDTLPGTRLGWGIRTKLLEGKMSSSDNILFNKYNNAINFKDLVGTILEDFDDKVDSTITKNIDLIEAINKKIESSIAISQFTNKDEIKLLAKNWLDAVNKNFIKNNPTKKDSINDLIQYIKVRSDDKKLEALGLQKLQQTKVGWICEIAAAGIQYYPNNTTDNSNFVKAGGWILLTYRDEKQKDEFTFLARWIGWSNDSFSTNLDSGLGYNRIVSNDFNYGFEYVFRNQSVRYNTKDILGNDIRAIKSNGTYRFAMKMNYKLSDDINLNACIGKDFDGPITSNGNLLALLGVNFSLPTKQTLKVN